MNTRFATSLTAAAAGAFVVVASQVFTTGTTGWITFGVGIGALALALGTAPLGRHVLEHAVDGTAAALAVWTIIASLVFSGDVLLWLSFAEGAGIAGLALLSHVLNEVRVTGQIHQLDTSRDETRRTPVGVAA